MTLGQFVLTIIITVILVAIVMASPFLTTAFTGLLILKYLGRLG